MRKLEHFRKNFSIRNAASFFWHALSTLLRGYASSELAHARSSICETCDHYDVDEVTCKLCGCGLWADADGKDRFYEKVYHKSSSCPIKKW